ncbi:MAG: DUF3352 domain-containing protein [Vampirovibrio sp.]|nr:DUF3352 domain-containing protein [Vampirovibrio sp.]
MTEQPNEQQAPQVSQSTTTPATNSPKKGSKAPLLVGLALLVGGGIFLWQQFGGQGSDGPVNLHLNKYYPQATSFYIEFGPGEKLVATTFDNIKNVRDSIEDAKASQEPGSPLAQLPSVSGAPKSANQAPHVLETDTLDSPDAVTTTSESQTDFLDQLSENFNTLFKPYFALGIWPKASVEGHIDVQAPMDVLMVLPKKDNATDVPAIITQFKGDPASFTITEFEGTKIYTSRRKDTVLASHNENLLVSGNAKTVEEALKLYQAGGKNIFDAPSHSKYLAKLPEVRYGTLLIDNTDYIASSIAAMDEAPENQYVNKDALNRMKQVARLAPLSVAALQVSGEDRININSYTPLMMEEVTDAGLKQTLLSLYKESATFSAQKSLPDDTLLMVSFAGMDKSVDFFLSFMPDQQRQGMLAFAQMMLAQYELDFKQDVVAFFSGETSVAVRPEDFAQNNSLPIILLKGDEHKTATLDKLSKMMTTMKVPVKSSKVGSVAAKTLTVPGQDPLDVSFASIGKTDAQNVAIASTQNMQDIVAVNQGQADSLSKNASFKEMAKDFYSKGNVMFFADLGKISELSKQYPVEGKKPLDLQGRIGGSVNYLPSENAFGGKFVIQMVAPNGTEASAVDVDIKAVPVTTPEQHIDAAAKVAPSGHEEKSHVSTPQHKQTSAPAATPDSHKPPQAAQPAHQATKAPSAKAPVTAKTAVPPVTPKQQSTQEKEPVTPKKVTAPQKADSVDTAKIPPTTKPEKAVETIAPATASTKTAPAKPH